MAPEDVRGESVAKIIQPDPAGYARFYFGIFKSGFDRLYRLATIMDYEFGE